MLSDRDSHSPPSPIQSKYIDVIHAARSRNKILRVTSMYIISEVKWNGWITLETTK